MTKLIRITNARDNVDVRLGGIYEVIDETSCGAKIKDDVNETNWILHPNYAPVDPTKTYGRCVNDYDYDNVLTVGRIYEFRDCHGKPLEYDRFTFAYFIGDDGVESNGYVSRFKILQQGKPAAEAPSSTPANKDTAPMFTHLLLTFATDRKIHLIRELRHITGAGLRESKDMVENGIVFDTYSQLLDLTQALSNAYATRKIYYEGRTLPMPTLTISGWTAPKPAAQPVVAANYSFNAAA